jgi:hypothetical protein
VSNSARGLTPASASPHQIDLQRGISMFETEQQARQLALEMGGRYECVAEVAVPEGVRVERQGRRAGHYNVYASPDEFLEWLIRVIPVRLESGER